MDKETIQRYQAGGDIYNSLEQRYGTATADACATAALTGDRTQVTAALVQGKYGAALDTSTFDAFTTQIETNPLGAPFDSLNRVLKNTLLSYLENPLVVVVSVIVIILSGVVVFQLIKRSI